MSEEVRGEREAATLRLHGASHEIEVATDRAHAQSTVTHRRVGGAWIGGSRDRHLEAWASGGGDGGGGAAAALAALRLALLGDRLLTSLPSRGASEAQRLQAVLGGRWGDERRRWAPLEAGAHEEHATLAAAAERSAIDKRRSVAAIGAAAASDAAPPLLPWLVREAPASIDAVDLAAALSAAPPDVLRSAALRDALAARGGNDGESLEARLLRVDEDGALSSLGGLDVRERLQVLRFSDGAAA